jgi:hypothetical protein
MTREIYLKPEQHYLDLYDKQTVEHCRWVEKCDKDFALTRVKKGGKEVILGPIGNAFTEIRMYFETGERYMHKSETVRSWMEADKKSDEFFERAKAPQNITCFDCGRLMFVSSEHQERGFRGEKDRMMYFYDCPLEHMPRRAFYDDGEEYRPSEHVCSKCNSSTVVKHTRTEEKVTSVWTCSDSNCDGVETYELDLKSEPIKEVVIDENFEKDRARFCLSVKEGGEYISGRANLQALSDLMSKEKEKEEKKEVYEEVSNLKKLKILELEELLVPELEKAKYVKFHMKDPEIGRDVHIPFVVYDSLSERNDRTSKFDLEKLLKKVLKDTNWRLMSDGVNYRLGMLEGRLRAYEKEEDLVKLVESKK